MRSRKISAPHKFPSCCGAHRSRMAFASAVCSRLVSAPRPGGCVISFLPELLRWSGILHADALISAHRQANRRTRRRIRGGFMPGIGRNIHHVALDGMIFAVIFEPSGFLAHLDYPPFDGARMQMAEGY